VKLVRSTYLKFKKKCAGQAAMKEAEMEDDNDDDEPTIRAPTTKSSKKTKGGAACCEVKGCKSLFLQLDELLHLGQDDADHWTASAAKEVSAITAGVAGATAVQVSGAGVNGGKVSMTVCV
jgi:hypothetical protein